MRREGVCFSRSSVDPTKRLKVFLVRMFRALVRKSDYLVVSDLGHQNNCSYFLYLRIIGRTYAIHVASDLDAQIRDANKLLQHILRQYICVPRLLQVFRIHINMVSSQMHVGR